MSLALFIPTLWEARLLAHLGKNLVYASRTRSDWYGEIKEKGDTVTIGQIGDPTISDYADTDNIAPEELQSAEVKVTVDHAKKFSFFVKDVDKAQAIVNGMDEAMRRSAYKLRDTIDQAIAAYYTQAGIVYGTDVAPNTVNSANVGEVLATMGQKLDEANVPTDGRYAIVPPWFHTKLLLAKILTSSDNVDALNNGRVGRSYGFEILVSNNVPTTAGPHYKITAGRSDAIAFAQKTVTIEAFRPEAKFRDAIKGLHIYGGRVIEPDQLLCATCDILAEP